MPLRTTLLSTTALLAAGACAAQPLPARLQDTGLYKPGSLGELAPGVVAFSPQYPLWSDDADKQRWLRLPPGRAIDASQPDAWRFPAGTRLWKQFAVHGRPVETRYIERRADGRWAFAAYVWSADGQSATLAPAGGAVVPVAGAPQGRYVVPSRGDCLACHGSNAVPVIGFSALQLSPDRDPLAAHARPRGAAEIDLPALVQRGWLRGLPAALLQTPPRIAARTALERAALGTLHGNCAHCHNSSGYQVPLALNLAQRVADAAASHADSLRTMLHAPSRFQPAGAPTALPVVAPGHAETSVLALRMQSRAPQTQMPPLGTRLPDGEGLALVLRWINEDLSPHPENPR